MKVLAENNITACDVDNTLVIWPKNYHQPKPGTIEFDYGGQKIHLYPHIPHIIFLKHCFLRGDFVEVWSQNGFAWAEQVVKKLDLQNHVDLVRSKPTRHIDDKVDLSDIVGNRVFMKYDPEG